MQLRKFSTEITVRISSGKWKARRDAFLVRARRGIIAAFEAAPAQVNQHSKLLSAKAHWEDLTI
jgi:hypothetical protein